jgi:hypothetical protein
MFIKEYIVYLTHVLALLKSETEIKLISCGSYRVELLFGYLRMMSHYDNSITKAQHVIEKTILLQYLND